MILLESHIGKQRGSLLLSNVYIPLYIEPHSEIAWYHTILEYSIPSYIGLNTSFVDLTANIIVYLDICFCLPENWRLD